MRAVVDTNVFVSAFLTPPGTCGRLLAALMAGDFTLVVDQRVIWEYQNVLRKAKFGFDRDLVDGFIVRLEAVAEWVTAPPAGIHLPDETDVKFVEVALAALADCLVTGNARHFPAKACKGVRVLSPQQFIDQF